MPAEIPHWCLYPDFRSGNTFVVLGGWGWTGFVSKLGPNINNFFQDDVTLADSVT